MPAKTLLMLENCSKETQQRVSCCLVGIDQASRYGTLLQHRKSHAYPGTAFRGPPTTNQRRVKKAGLPEGITCKDQNQNSLHAYLLVHASTSVGPTLLPGSGHVATARTSQLNVATLSPDTERVCDIHCPLYDEETAESEESTTTFTLPAVSLQSPALCEANFAKIL